jgi:cation diffusion facilitator CzcD-associated flavoprotein CzcO
MPTDLREPDGGDVDVLIVGAGVSGIGAAYHLQHELPDKTYAILEQRDAIGGTWDLFRYPGIRSDSDLHTFGYAFKPWTDRKAIADGSAIRAYVEETARENGIDRHIRFGRRVLRAAWSSDTARWTVEAEDTNTGATSRLTARWLFSAAGYYRYDEGYTPELPGLERFRGTVVHPQDWPLDLDYAGKRVVVIGSGATAMTIVPAMAPDAAHVTMLQRSPTYVIPLPSEDRIANWLRRHLGERRAYALTRRKNIRQQQLVYASCRRFPKAARRVIRAINARQLRGTGVDVDVHFNPSYDPWDQRLCVVPDADLYRALGAGDASIVTDHIETFTEDGIRLRSGRQLEADIVVTATGLNLQAFGGVDVRIDGAEVRLPDTVAYKGLMLSGVPNFAFAIGYTNASWTLKVDLVCEYLCRLIGQLDALGHDACVPELDGPVETRPLLNFQAGYVLRSLDAFPRQGDRAPWHLAMSYDTDVQTLRGGRIDDGTLRFLDARRPASDALRLAA